MNSPVFAPTPAMSPRDIIDQEGLNKLLKDLNHSKDSFNVTDREAVNRALKSLNYNFENLKETVRYLTDDKGVNLKKMNPDNLRLIIEVIADNPQEAKHLQELLKNGDYQELARRIEQATNNPEKLIEISEIMLMDSSIPQEIKNKIFKNLQEINNLLKTFHGLSDRYTLVMPVQPFGAQGDERRQEFAQEIGRFIQRRTLEEATAKVIDGLVDLVITDKTERQEKLAEIRELIVHNRTEQGHLRQNLFLLRVDQKDEYRDLMRQIVNLATDENRLLEQERKYRRDPVAVF